MKHVLLSTVLLAGAVMLPPIANADDLRPGDSGWQHRFAVYLWGAGLDGDAGNKFSSGKVEASFSDILSNLEAGFMADYRGKKGRWAVNLDVVYLKISPNPEVKGANPLPIGPRQIDTNVDTDIKQWIVDLTGGYELTQGLDLIAGARYVNLDVDARVALPGDQQLRIGGSEDWLDPIVGFTYRGYFPNSSKWKYLTRGDIGGFGVGSDLTWQAYAYIGYQPTRNWTLFGGYRHLYFDYEANNDKEFFYKVAISGPALGASYQF